MVGKIGIGAQEEIVGGHSRIPGGIQVVVQLVQSHDIPGVATIAAGLDTGNDPGIHIQLQRQPVEQIGVALTHGSLVHQRRIGGVLQQVTVVFQIVVVISNIGANVVIDTADLCIVGLAIQRQFLQKGSHSSVQLLFLLQGGVVGHREIEGDRGSVVGSRCLVATILEFQIVALHGVTGMVEQRLQNLIHVCTQFFLGRNNHVGTGINGHGEGADTVFHIFPDSMNKLRLRGVGCIRKNLD